MLRFISRWLGSLLCRWNALAVHCIKYEVTAALRALYPSYRITRLSLAYARVPTLFGKTAFVSACGEIMLMDVFTRSHIKVSLHGCHAHLDAGFWNVESLTLIHEEVSAIVDYPHSLEMRIRRAATVVSS